MPCGHPVYAAMHGKVLYNNKSDSGGNFISIESTSLDPITQKPIIYNYMHLEYLSDKKTGSMVYKNDLIGYAGRTGYVEGPGCHLHLEMYSKPYDNLKNFGASNYPNYVIDPKLFYGVI